MPDNCTVYHRAAGCGVCEFLRSLSLVNFSPAVPRAPLATLPHPSRDPPLYRYLIAPTPLHLRIVFPENASLNALTIDRSPSPPRAPLALARFAFDEIFFPEKGNPGDGAIYWPNWSS